MTKQFDVFANPSSQSMPFAPYIVVLQSHLLDVIDTVIVAPIVRDAGVGLRPFDVKTTIGEEQLFIATAEMGSVEKRLLSKPLATVADQEADIRRAIDRLFTGF